MSQWPFGNLCFSLLNGARTTMQQHSSIEPGLSAILGIPELSHHSRLAYSVQFL